MCKLYLSKCKILHKVYANFLQVLKYLFYLYGNFLCAGHTLLQGVIALFEFTFFVLFTLGFLFSYAHSGFYLFLIYMIVISFRSSPATLVSTRCFGALIVHRT